MAKINPFKPNSPVRPGMFVGRLAEIERLESHLLQTVRGNPSNFLVTGERGIGKSSLLNYLKWVAAGDIAMEDDTKLRFLVIDTDIEPSTTQVGLVQKIELGLRRELAKTEPARAFLRKSWEFLQRIEAGGVRLHKADEEADQSVLIEEFAYSLAETIDRLTSPSDGPSTFGTQYDGVLILIDEADNASRDLRFGAFIKLLLERVHRRGCDRVMVGLAGLPHVRQTLVEGHPSSLRLFDTVVLDRLSQPEVGRVMESGLEQAEKDNGVKYTITPSAQSLLAVLSDGYPHFIQQFGFSAFDVDQDNVIDREDVTKGAFGKMGALEALGDRYYRDDFYNKIQEESYRQVLRIMADKLDGWVTKTEIRDRFRGGMAVLNNAIKALRDRHIILSKEGERGVYRLQHKGFALWIKLKTTDPRELQRVASEEHSGTEETK